MHSACSTALILSLTAVSAPALPSPDGCCQATNARYNVSGQPKEGYDFIPVVPDDSLGFYVVYSVRSDDSGTGVGSTSCIYLLELADEEVLVFGAGWGSSAWLGWALYDADHDVASIREVIEHCMGLDPARVRLRFVAPHGHPDHVNAAFIKAIDAAGLALVEIAYHEGDRDWIEQLPWLPHHPALFHVLEGSACGSELLSYASPLGRIWFTPRPGHTPGSIDLVLDVGGDPAGRVLVRGSAAGGGCSLPPGVFMALDAHGTAIIGGERRAQAKVLAGRGLNPPCLSSNPPRPGSSWIAQVDTSSHPGATYVCLIGAACPLEPGLLGNYGELLVNLAAGPRFSLVQQSSGGVDIFSQPIPNDPTLLGKVCYIQATILGGGPELCNAIELVIGF